MKLGQTSAIVFVSKVLGSALGFVATVYFARVLGAEIIGVFAGVIALVGWLKMGGYKGIGYALQKRVSEGKDRGEFLTAAIFLLFVYVLVVSLLVVILVDAVEVYLEDFERFAPVSVVWFVIGVLVAKLSFSLVAVTLRGTHRVHIAGLLEPVKTGVQSILQIALVFAGFELVGMLTGYIIGGIVVAVFGTVYITIGIRRPTLEHIRSLLSYAKFSWFGGLKSRAINDVDIVVLTALVSSGLVGIYAIAWSLAKFLDLFGSAVSKAAFPEISKSSATDNPDAAVDIINDAIAFAGLIAIPGVVGGFVLADRLLLIYGPEFVDGQEVLGLLLIAVLLYSYLRQFLNALNAIDRPEVAFRVNAVFVTVNIVLNITLVSMIGWVGAAVASVSSIGIALIVSAVLLNRITAIELPVGEFSRQVTAAFGMGVTVWLLKVVEETTAIISHNTLLVLTLVTVGACLYVCLLAIISTRFRNTVQRNLPVDIPLLST